MEKFPDFLSFLLYIYFQKHKMLYIVFKGVVIGIIEHLLAQYEM
jgi:hypothetical protein